MQLRNCSDKIFNYKYKSRKVDTGKLISPKKTSEKENATTIKNRTYQEQRLMKKKESKK